jgi:hypothetical protein
MTGRWLLAASGVVAVLVACVALPLATYTLALACFGLAHVGSELRYLDLRFGTAPRPRPSSAAAASSFSAAAAAPVSAVAVAAAIAASSVPASAFAPRARRTLGGGHDEDEGACGAGGPTFVQLPATAAPAPAYVLETARAPSAFLNPRAQRHLHANIATVSGLGGNTERHMAEPEPRPSAKKHVSRTAMPGYAPFATVTSLNLSAAPAPAAAASAAPLESARSSGRRHIAPAEPKERFLFGWGAVQ